MALFTGLVWHGHESVGMADAGNITIHMQGLRAAHAAARLDVLTAMGKHRDTAVTGAGCVPDAAASSAPDTIPTAASVYAGVLGDLPGISDSKEIHAMLTSKEAFMACVCRVVADKGFEPLSNVFEMTEW